MGLIGVFRASSTRVEEIREVTGMMIGAVTPLALPDRLLIYADVRPLEMDYIILGAGSRSGKLKKAPLQLEKLADLEFFNGLSISPE